MSKYEFIFLFDLIVVFVYFRYLRIKPTIADLIDAHRDLAEMKRIEKSLLKQGFYITYGPAGVYWAEPNQK